MSTTPTTFREASFRSAPIRDLGLQIAGTRLEPIIEEFRQELAQAAIRQPQPHFYLSTEWGVPFGTVAIGIPFYLAHPELVALHAEHVGHIEGFNRGDILRYLRHEMGHVVNYAYKLYEDEGWVKQFGAITQPYVEEYRPEPFSARFVQHLPGWYAQKHPDEDWSETFAVWMTPNCEWRSQYSAWPVALAKLEYCDATMARLRDQAPVVTSLDLDDDVRVLRISLTDYYSTSAPADSTPQEARFFHEAGLLPPGLDGALRSVFEDLGEPEESDGSVPRLPASTLIRKLQQPLMAHVFRWTGHFPEKTRELLRHLARRADELHQVYPQDREAEATLAITTLVTSLAMTHVYRGHYLS
jgi:hypothetical protein